ncbi:hypothetical protein F3Y22_tig00006991pilonHSYRG00009 [Hibiscus syriacus]|uniref:Reverse transcriptase domain-containing protein n=1 Tax=Hibiscus syriacus TaxID=106335 RepID=A0A6A3CB99_HIBSY|nr:hypothetical protein F3Y22_tig00006991pilonHSYRG00009 [Hibiscus syriacus]
MITGGEKEMGIGEQVGKMAKELSDGQRSPHGILALGSQLHMDLERNNFSAVNKVDSKKLKMVMENNMVSFEEGSFSNMSVRDRRNVNRDGISSGSFLDGKFLAEENFPPSENLSRVTSQSSQASVEARIEAVATRETDEKLGAFQNWHTIELFRNFVQQTELMDLPLVGGSRHTMISDSISILDNKILDMELNLQNNSFSPQDWRQLSLLKSELWRLHRIDERIWFQKSRAKWIKEGDKNTRERLEVQFSEQEVWEAISSSDSNKPPGPDGLTMGFMKRCWHFLKDSVMKFFAIFIRIRIGNTFAFIPGRQLLDCAFIANEAIDYWREKGLKGVVFKADFCKAYDTIEWPILLRIMKETGFGERWCSWISYCLSTASVSVLLNGTPTKEIPMPKGLRQVGGSAYSCQLSHLQFADDLIIFCTASIAQIRYVKRILRAKKNSEVLWEPILQSFNNKLASWKASTLSMAGSQKLNSLMAGFLWGEGSEKKHIHWVKWRTVCRSKDEGGLVILDLNLSNRALLGKWIWKFANEKDTLWKNFICCKHNLDSSTMSVNSVYSSQDSWIWKGIVSSFLKNDVIGERLRSHSRIQVGNGKSISFWNDVWADCTPLKFQFPRIFVLSTNKSGRVREFGNYVSNGWIWDIRTRRNLCDWELEQWLQLMIKLNNSQLTEEVDDFLSWTGKGDGLFTVSSCRRIIGIDQLANPFWKNCVWTETVQHLFIVCPVAHEVWTNVLNLWNVSTVLPGDICSLISSWSDLVTNSMIWNFVPAVVLWSIWNYRNSIFFENMVLDRSSLFFIIKVRLVKWFLAKFHQVQIPVDSLIADPTLADGYKGLQTTSKTVHKWLPPPADFFKFNVDGAVRKDGLIGGIGGILKNHNGFVLATFSERLGPGPPPLAELKAIRKAVGIFYSSVWASKGRLILETD